MEDEQIYDWIQLSWHVSDRHPRRAPLEEYCLDVGGLQLVMVMIVTHLLGIYYERVKALDVEDSPNQISHKKFLVTLAEEDVAHRLYAYREKVHQLVNAALAVGLDPKDHDLRPRLRDWLAQNGEGAVRDHLDTFARQEITDLLGQRHRLVHRLSRPELKALSGGTRLLEFMTSGTLDDWDDRLATSLDVDAHKTRLVEKLTPILHSLSHFEERLCQQLARSLDRRGWLA